MMTDKQTEQMQAISRRIKERREELGFSFQQLADLTKMSKSTLQRYETGGIKNIPLDKLEILAKSLSTSPEWILGWERKITDMDKTVLNHYPGFNPGKVYINELDSVSLISADNVFMRPLYDSVAAGFNALAQNTVIGYIPTQISSPSEQEKYIWVNVVGDSMSPMIDDGSKILIKLQDSVDSGQIAIVLIDDEEAVVKRVVYGEDWIELQSVNPYYPPRRFEGQDVQRIRIMGLVKEVSKSIQ